MSAGARSNAAERLHDNRNDAGFLDNERVVVGAVGLCNPPAAGCVVEDTIFLAPAAAAAEDLDPVLLLGVPEGIQVPDRRRLAAALRGSFTASLRLDERTWDLDLVVDVTTRGVVSLDLGQVDDARLVQSVCLRLVLLVTLDDSSNSTDGQTEYRQSRVRTEYPDITRLHVNARAQRTRGHGWGSVNRDCAAR